MAHNIYEEFRDFSAETRRLEEFEFPLFVTQAVLPQDQIHGYRFCDIGAGPDIKTQLYVENSGGTYIPVDRRPDFMEQRKLKSKQFFVAEATSLPFADCSIDICHMRFVLMHLLPELQIHAIRECLRCARRITTFIEYDWITFEGPPLVNAIRDELISRLSQKMDFFIGRRLEKTITPLVGRGKELITKEFSREYGNYRHELLPLLDSAIGILGDKSGTLKTLRPALVSADASAISFSPPTVISVTVRGR